MLAFIFLVLLTSTLSKDTFANNRTCPNTPGKDDLYFIRQDFYDTISYSANYHTKWYFNTSRQNELRYGSKMYKQSLREPLKELFANWAQWCDDNSIKYVIGHGTLLGWIWNERILLWDEDLEVMIDQGTFIYLIKYNQTKINGRYLLDINPYYRYRGYGEHNAIDAKFIDLEKGLYIDITMLSHTNHNATNATIFKYGLASESLNCTENCLEDKSVHRYDYDLIFPFRRAKLEGIDTWIPNKPDEVLDQEYTSDARLNPEFTVYSWDFPEDWVPDDSKVIMKPGPPGRNVVTNKYTVYRFSLNTHDFYVKDEYPKTRL